MRKKLIIIGAGNVGGFLSYNIKYFGNFEVLGFLDDDPDKQGKQLYGRKVIGRVAEIERHIDSGNVSAVVGISSPVAKRDIVERLSGVSIDFPNFISRDVWRSNQLEIGKGVIIYPGTRINYETTIADFVIMNMNCAIGHNCFIGSYSSLAPGVNLAGFTTVEEMVSVGIGVSTRQGIRLGKLSTIGGQSMLISDVEAHTVVAGVPAKVLTS